MVGKEESGERRKMSRLQIFRWTVKSIFWLALVILTLNIENLVSRLGLGDLLVKAAPILTWLLCPALVFIGGGLALWIDGWLRKSEATKALDDLYAEGVGHRNRLIQPLLDYDDAAERTNLEEWGERVLKRSREAGVRISARSAFRTLNLFTPQFHKVAGKMDAQSHVEAMWNEKLSRRSHVGDLPNTV